METIVDNNKVYYELRKFRYKDAAELEDKLNQYSCCHNVRRVIFMENAMPDSTDIFHNNWFFHYLLVWSQIAGHTSQVAGFHPPSHSHSGERGDL